MTMSNKTDDLEASDTWDWAAAATQPGQPGAVVTVSVRYSADEFQAIAECAEREGLTVTDFIRTVALEAAREQSRASADQ